MMKTLSDQLNTMAQSAIASLPSIAIAAIIIALTWGIAKWGKSITYRVAYKADLKPSLQNLAEILVQLFIWLAGVLLAALVVFPGFSPSGLLAGVGIGAVAIGFAFQDFFENFLAGVMIMLRDKMQIGDIVKTGEIHGEVELINLRETHIRAFSGELHVLPNTILFKQPVEVVTSQKQRRFEITVGVSYDTDLDQADAVIREAVESVALVHKDKPVQILADNFNSSSVDFKVRWWAPSSGSDAVMNRDQVVRSIKRALDEAGIEIPFPYVTHTFKHDVPLGDPITKAA